jgi:hypothetical protein
MGNVVYPDKYQASAAFAPSYYARLIRQVRGTPQIQKELIAYTSFLDDRVESLLMKTETRSVPSSASGRDRAYVRVSAVTKSVSAFVILICIFSLVVSFSTDFSIINRFVSVIVAFMAGGFYLIGIMLDKNNGPSNHRAS